MKRLYVNLLNKSYYIEIGTGLIDIAGEMIECNAKKVFIITDENVAPLYLEKLKITLEKNGATVFYDILPAGEKSKSLKMLSCLYTSMIKSKITRTDIVVALGGGVIGDLAGFAAATYLRGVEFVQIPTSLLAQVDSSVGGKVAIDLSEGKNLVGAFYQPKKVIIDLNALKTLPDKFYRDGMAEVIKYGCIKDKCLFEKLLNIKTKDDFFSQAEDIVYTCCNIKRQVVERDEKDKGERIILNFGHTYGHAVEKVLGYGVYSHGEAVAIGMNFITEISEKNGQTERGTTDKIKQVLENFSLPYECDLDIYKAIEAIANDKKNFDGALNVVLIKEIGKSYVYSTTGGYFLK